MELIWGRIRHEQRVFGVLRIAVLVNEIISNTYMIFCPFYEKFKLALLF